MSRWGMASTFLDSMTGPGFTGVEWCSAVELLKDFCGASGCLCIDGGADVVPRVVNGTGEVFF